ncbi:CsiV family protein [Endozoicomonas elysicola]|uniref:Peptidoglycan-binding protein CsiV n=1 Tax=Endozoicomonas elysicola TaxID=305900 RepID=A0A081KCF1_9GAMM|nr:CsiV family protein [Endozoicomonas elysicola]KEI71827.1 hypothetical protein GV64_14730 [Endozoicomonas elysicola]
MKKVQLIALSIALFFNFSLSASENESNPRPKDQWYQIDLVVFHYAKNDSGEAWPPVTEYRTPANAIRLRTLAGEHSENSPLFEIPESGNPHLSYHDIVRDAYISLPVSEMILNKQVATLEKNRGYQVLAQKAWRMPLNPGTPKHPVEIRAAISGQDSLLLDGTVTVSEERFLHVDIDLWLNKLSPESLYSTLSGKTYNHGPSSSDVLTSNRGSDNLIRLHDGSPPLRITENFQVKQRRRIKNTNEIQYFDSPEIGVILKLTPYQRPNALVETGV